MEKITAGHPLSQSEDIVKQNIDTLKSLFPTIVKEGKIDLSELRSLLGDDVEENEEYYRFTWAGKSQARLEANKPSTGTLRPNKKDSKDWDNTKNLFLEGDNLEVLKLLQKSYAGQIKMIYIDPPYNTGKDFVYKDNYKDNLGNYLALTNQLDEEGNKVNTNSENDGRYHSNWLDMMYPRLKLARNLLKDDGVIFISIDDHEVQNLRKLCEEIFGEENFIANVIWERAFSPKNDSKFFSENHDYIITIAKNSEKWRPYLLKRTNEANERYKNYDNDERGLWISDNLTAKTYSAKYDFPITTPSGKIINPSHGSCWRVSKEKFDELVMDKRIWWGTEGNNVPRLKRFLSEVQDGMTITTIWKHNEVGHNQSGRQELKRLFDDKGFFDGPKPVSLLERIVSISTKDNDYVLDFFAGSGTTAHAVMKVNSEDGGRRKYICVQIPEPIERDTEAFNEGFTTIAEITKERIRRAGDKVNGAVKSSLFDGAETLDIGFKAFNLDTSNINAWDGNKDNFEQNLFNSANNIKSGRTEEDVLYEILIKSGLDLSEEITAREMAGKQVFSIGLGALFICLSDSICTTIAEGIGHWKTELAPATCKVIFKDSGFTDVEKTNSIQILKRFGITEVNSI
jgi:adenine-specific DNA-methyltransferase